MSLQREQSEECIELLLNFSHPEIYPPNAVFGITFAILQWLYVSFFIVFYAIRRQYSPFLKFRPFTFVILTGLDVAFEATWSLREWYGRHLWPCYLTQVSILVQFWLGLVPILIRVILFWRKVEYSKYLANVKFYQTFKQSYMSQYGKLKKNNEKIIPKKSIGDDSIMGPEGLARSESLANLLNQLSLGASENLKTRSRYFSVIDTNFDTNMEQLEAKSFVRSEDMSQADVKLNYKRKLKMRKFLASKKFGALLFFIASIVFIPAMIDSTAYVSNCFGCETLESRETEFIISVLSFFGFLLIIFFVFFKIRNEPDPLEIMKEIKIGLSLGFLIFLIWAPIDVIDVGNRYRDGYIYYGYIFQLALLAMFTVFVPYQIWKSYRISKFNLAIQNKQNFGSASSEFEAYMQSTIARENFKLHLMSEFSIENYYFWREIKKWQDGFKRMTVISRKAQFMFIIENYIIQGATFEVNIKGDIKAHFEEQLEILQSRRNGNREEEEDEEVEITVDCFDEALAQVLRILIFGPFSRFKIAEEKRPFDEASVAPFEASFNEVEEQIL